MKIETLNIPAAGTWARDCELMSFVIGMNTGFMLKYHKDSDNTYWSLTCEAIPAYKVIGEEFSRIGYLGKLPVEDAFFEILDSPWIKEFGKEQAHILDKCKHYVLRFYDETVEIIAKKFVFEQLKEKPE